MTTIKKEIRKSSITKKNSRKKPLKYSDKSAGQPELVSIFDRIKNLIKKYEKNNFEQRNEKPGSYSLFCIAPIEIAEKKFDEICFAGLLIQKGYVGFYFFPIYAHPPLAKLLNAGLMRCLKGKTCFYIKNNDDKLMNEIAAALQTGFQFYSKQGWA
jgi:hypothetical protein